MTRYPKRGKGAKWTAIELKAIPAAWAGDTLSEEGLQGEVRASSGSEVTVRFKTAYKWESKLCWHYCGTFPQASLEDIRGQREWCRDQVRAGINPADRKRLDKVEAQAAVEKALADEEARIARDKTLKQMFEDWLDRGVKRQDGNVELRRSIEKDVYSSTHASTPVRLVDDLILTGIVKAVIERGSLRQAVIICRQMAQCYAWANKRAPWRGLLHEGQQGNPMELVELKTLLPADYDMQNVRERVLLADEIRKLWDTLKDQREAYESASNKRVAPQPLEMTSEHALWLCLSTMCRIGELTMAEWRHVDFVAGTWFIPKENTKEKTFDLTVYLSEFALEQFTGLHKLTKHSKFCFPSINDSTKHRDVKTVTKQVGDRQAKFHSRALKGRRSDNSLVIGEAAWTPHDLRRTGATLMQELGVSGEVIDRCQNHVIDASKVRRHYQQYDFAREKTQAWAILGTRLQAILGFPSTLKRVA